MQKKRVIIILFTIAFIFLLKQVQGAEDLLSLEGLGESAKIEYKSENLRDPFQEEKPKVKGEEKAGEKERQPEKQIAVETKPLPSLEIQGIIWGSSLPLAIINNKVLKIGDTIEEARITDISKGKVSVFFGIQEYNLSISSPVNPRGPDKIRQGGGYER